MSTHLSDHLKETRDALIRRFNTFIAMAEELEDDLDLAELKLRDACGTSAKILPFPRSPTDGGSAA
ncbi:hypothetical protein SAMN05892877_12353 [Rhizobium subbaraonis]|uniref:Uncharacterized protein n=1 Tax=Rhizobium subbaraonis TaxID=908946 RepID=A0A285UZ32_9HYPH|nr:hypothetical protein [Rhizobium subbaraonis]SOC46608.1 hypothetical protein SAMN05892877_12353 [Rhizobium subbaraonis]